MHSADVRPARAFAIASLAACALGPAILLVLDVRAARLPRSEPTGLHFAAADVLETAFAVGFLVLCALAGLALARAARHRAPRDPLVTRADSVSVVCLIAVVLLGPLIVRVLDVAAVAIARR